MPADWDQMANAAAALRDGGGMMPEEDSRVKKLQELAWGLQSLCNKPGNKLPEAYKREVYRVTSKAIAHCNNAAYTEEADFMKRAAELTKEIEAKKVEVGTVEETEKQKLTGKCYRAGGGGGYSVGLRADSYYVDATSGTGALKRKPPECASTLAPVVTPAATTTLVNPERTGAASVSAAEVAARCSDDPEALWLCDLGLRDADMDNVCEGLRRGGSKLTSLDLSHNSIGDAGVQKLATEFAKGTCRELRDLWIGGNAFTDLGVQILSGGLCALRRGLTVHLAEQEDVGGSIGRAAQAPIGEAATNPAAPGLQNDGEEALDTTPAEVAASIVEDVRATESPIDEQLASAVLGNSSSSSAVQIEVRSFGQAGDSEREIRATVPLPDNVVSAQDLDLDVSRSRFVVRARSDNAVLADRELPYPVDPDSTQAKFSSKKRTVTLVLRVDA